MPHPIAVGQLRVHFEPVVEADFDALVALREAALRESLERLGLFSQERSRERLGSNFRPEFMRHIVCDGKRVGLLTVFPDGDALKLQHLYLSPEAQGQGIGAWALEQVRSPPSSRWFRRTDTAPKARGGSSRSYSSRWSKNVARCAGVPPK